MSDTWKRCSSCKTDIAFSSTYYVCSVSTCTRKRTGFSFCSVECWETHLPMMRHREAWAVEEQAPTRAQWEAEGEGDEPAPSRGTSAPARPPASVPSDVPRRRRVVEAGSAPPESAGAAPREVLVIASRLKTYVKQRFGMNTSDGVLDPLSDHLRALCHRAAENAREEGRKTLLDRDFEFLKRS
jgi:hypothetical protein